MKKHLKLIALLLVFVFSFGMLISCYGSFVVFHKLHKWNGTIGNKWLRSTLHIVLWIIPVYEICILVDLIILNVVEFWSGSNPMAMKEGQREDQIVQYKGEKYQITATKNRFDIVRLTGPKSGERAALVYVPDSSAWFVESGMIREKVLAVDETNPNLVKAIYPDGRAVQFDLTEMSR